MTDKTHILIVDDDPRIREMLTGYLEGEGYNAAGVESGEAMRLHLSENRADLVLLDLLMPGEDGLLLSRELRVTSEIPIIILTGKGDPIDRVIGLEVGADDYITKPFHLREVLARIRSVLRRSVSRPGLEKEPIEVEKGKLLEFSGWILDLVRRTLKAPDGSLVSLTTGEFNLLSVFASRPNRPLNRDQLMDMTVGRNWTPYDRSIDTQIGRLRKKLERDPSAPALVKTVRGVGYILTADVEKLD